MPSPRIHAVIVSVEFGDLLRLTLRRNAHHFHQITVITTPQDTETFDVVTEIAGTNGANFLSSSSSGKFLVYQTEIFYADGASFNKYRAVEEALSRTRRVGWHCFLDADIVLPADADFSEIKPGYLYTAPRRMLADPISYRDDLDWASLPLAPDTEVGGYLQLFHSKDSVLYREQWFSKNWAHAGGADSELQLRWPERRKLRLPFEVLHLGVDGQNWCGRITPRLEGSTHPAAGQRAQQLAEFRAKRKLLQDGIKMDHSHEKLAGPRLPGELC